MVSVLIFVGIDYHDAFVQLCVMNANGKVLLNARCENHWRSIVERVKGLGRVVRVGIESCSGAADLAEELVEKAGWSVDWAHPGYVSRMNQNPDKSDFTDSQMLADLVRVGYLPKVWLAPRAIRELRRLVRYRQQLVNERRDAKLRIGALLREHRLRHASVGRWRREWMAWVRQVKQLGEQSRWIMDRHLERLERLDGEIGRVEVRLGQATKEDAVVRKLMEEDGIGAVTAWTIRAEIGRFDRFASGKQLSRFCGLTPRNASSGCRQADAGLIRAGNPQLRAVLIEAAYRLIRYNDRWFHLASKMRRRGKPMAVVAAAVANRWMRWLLHRMQGLQAA
jgi:transposase